jgi:hypothetical protein
VSISDIFRTLKEFPGLIYRLNKAHLFHGLNSASLSVFQSDIGDKVLVPTGDLMRVGKVPLAENYFWGEGG